MAKQTASKVPQIRFKGFEEEWEEIFLGEIYKKIRNAFVGTATPYYTQKGHFYLQSNNVKNGEINRNTEIFINEEFYLKQKDNWLRSNDIVMVQSGHVGHTAVIPDELNNSAAHALIIISKPLRDTCSYYLNFYFQGNRARRELANITTGNTIKHILASDIKKFGVYFTHHDEQTKIGGYFRELDRLIGLHKRKHDKLVTLKKAMLQKMFPQPGATTPEIRFKGFSGDWMENKLGNVFSYERPDQYIVESSEYSNENRIPVLTANKAFILGYTNESRTFNKPCIIFDDFTLEAKYVDFPFMVKSSAIKLLTIQDNKVDDLYYAFLILSNAQIEIMGHARHYIGVVQPTLVRKPKIAEQQKIGTYFRTLDELISKHATQLKKLKQIKSACLEKMFT